uniref:Uncharacterized protein n=1 Tax=Drosophila melanogaster TaxID=7227 RepID=A0A6M3QGN8_DROME|nr:uncharacterized protein Dmel_CG46435 [Drosophila melanogaster]QJC18631.1 uncharacterized protein Dmel_CG46435 [Drosophila melanogaster]
MVPLEIFRVIVIIILLISITVVFSLRLSTPEQE